MKWLKILVLNASSVTILGLVLNLVITLGSSHPGEGLVLIAPMILFVVALIATCVVSAMLPMWLGDGVAMDWEVRLSMIMWGVFALIMFYQQLFTFISSR